MNLFQFSLNYCGIDCIIYLFTVARCNKTKIKIISKNWVRLSLAAKELWISRRVSVLDPPRPEALRRGLISNDECYS